jgi:MYXO-CTERM domain-containing protein
MKNMNTMTLLAAGTCAMIAASAANAAYVPNFGGTYTFPSGSPQTSAAAAGAYNGTAMIGLTPSSVTNAGTTWSSSSNNYRATNWAIGATSGSDTFTGSIDLTKYISFTLAADAGYSFDITSITFGIGRSATGPRQWQWRSSVDNYAAALTNYTTLAVGLTNTSGVLTNPDQSSPGYSGTGNVLTLNDASFKALTAVTFRLYGYNSESTTGTGGLQGPLTFVPAPGAIALLGVAGLVGGRRRR